MRILIVKLSSFGDVVHTFPAVTDLKAARPEIEVDWLVEDAYAPFVHLHSGVAHVYPLAFRRLRWPPARWPTLARDLRNLRRDFRARSYDLVVDLQGLMKSASLARLAGAPVAGYDEQSAREPAATRLYQRRFTVPKDMHAVERSRRLLAAAAGYQVPAGPERFGLVARGTPPRIPGLQGRYVLVFHSTSWPTKHWPEDRWRDLLARLSTRDLILALPWGSAAEKTRAERLAAGNKSAVVLPRVFAGEELAALISRAEFAIGLDTGLMHLAAALDVPGLSLFGPTDPIRSGPYGARQVTVMSDYPQAPCFRRRCDREPSGMCCMSAISVDRVEQALGGLLVDQAGGAG